MAVQMERFEANHGSIKVLQGYARKGIVVQAHAGSDKEPGIYCRDNITDVLAAFLIGAGEYSYFGCAVGWYIEPDWIVWHPEYDRPLGAPDGEAVFEDGVYHRTFASGTKVTFDTTDNTGFIAWK